MSLELFLSPSLPWTVTALALADAGDSRAMNSLSLSAALYSIHTSSRQASKPELAALLGFYHDDAACVRVYPMRDSLSNKQRRRDAPARLPQNQGGIGGHLPEADVRCNKRSAVVVVVVAAAAVNLAAAAANFAPSTAAAAAASCTRV